MIATSRGLTSARELRNMRAMSLLLNFINTRLRRGDSAEPESHFDSHEFDSTGDEQEQDNVFNLLPPEDESGHVEAPEPIGRNVHPVDMTDLSRLSIDTDGRLYWDGKPVEVQRRLLMSREQIIGACLIGAFVAIGALGAVVQGTSAARDWACRFGWASSICGPSSAPRNAFDIPA
jgi:hypothetical protein